MGRRPKTRKILVEADPAMLGSAFVASNTNIAKAYNYYHANVELKKARDWVEQFLVKFNFSEETKQQFPKIHDDRVPMWLCVNCHLLNNDAQLPVNIHEKTIERIKEIVANHSPQTRKVDNNPSELGNPVIAFVEGYVDNFYDSGYVLPSPDLYDYFKRNEVKQSDVRSVKDYYQDLYVEIQLNDADIREAYSHLSSKQRKNYIAFIGRILDDCNKYLETERKVRTVRKPRKKKVKSADQLTSSVKFKAEDLDLQIASVSPSKIVGAQGVWLYNTKYNRLTLLLAADDSKLSVKGTTVIGFDESLSKTKSIRKPKENLAKLMAMSKFQMKKEFSNLKSKEQAATGRLGSETVILKVI